MNVEQFKQDLMHLKWSQAKLAAKLGVTTVIVSNWATGKVKIPSYAEEYLRVAKLAKEILE